MGAFVSFEVQGRRLGLSIRRSGHDLIDYGKDGRAYAADADVGFRVQGLGCRV